MRTQTRRANGHGAAIGPRGTIPPILHSALAQVALDKLKPHPSNPRQGDVGAIHESITANGFYGALVVQKSTGYILAGNHRWKAAKEAGLKKLPVFFVDVDDDRAIRILLADNRTNDLAAYDEPALAALLKGILAETDSLVGTGYDTDALDALLRDCELGGLVQEDEPPPLAQTARSKRGEVYALGAHRLMCGDATSAEDVGALMAGEKADMVFTDPPYGMNLDTDYSKIMGRGNKYAKVIGDDVEWIFNTADHFNCSEQIWWGADYYRRTLPQFGSWYVWDKQISDHDGASHTGSLFEMAWSKTVHKREIIKVPHFSFYGMDTKKRLHPTQKPVKLCCWFLDKLSKTGALVADIFGGSGSTLIACEQLMRRCRMMEIDPLYCDVIRKRWKIKNDGEEAGWEKATPLVHKQREAA